MHTKRHEANDTIFFNFYYSTLIGKRRKRTTHKPTKGKHEFEKKQYNCFNERKYLTTERKYLTTERKYLTTDHDRYSRLSIR